MSASYQADTDTRDKLKLCFGYSRIFNLLQDITGEERCDQIMCHLVNLSNCSAEKIKDILAECDDLIKVVATILQTSMHTGLLMGACQFVKNLADNSLPDFVHHQNRLDEYGVKVRLEASLAHIHQHCFCSVCGSFSVQHNEIVSVHSFPNFILLTTLYQ